MLAISCPILGNNSEWKIAPDFPHTSYKNLPLWKAENSEKSHRQSGRGLGVGYQYLDFSAHFYGVGLFLRKRLISISTEEAYFYGGGLFLQRRLIFTEEDHFYGGGLFLWTRIISIVLVGSFVGRRSVSMQQPHLSMENKTHRTEQVSFNTERTFFPVHSSGPSGPPYKTV